MSGLVIIPATDFRAVLDGSLLTDADTWKIAHSILNLLADGHFRDCGDLDLDLPGMNYRPMLEALIQAGWVEAVDHEEYGVVYMQSDAAKGAQ